MRKNPILYIVTVLGLIVVVGALVGTKVLQFSAMDAAKTSFVPPPETVTMAAVTEDIWENALVSTGSLAAVQGVTVAAEVPGKVDKINFDSGATVAAGDLLVQLDISSETAQLRSAEASADLARLNLARARELRENNTNANSDLDAADAQAKQASATVDALAAAIAKKSVRAPFPGRLGLRQVNLGQILKDGESIVTLQTLDPIYINFSVPQQRLDALVVGATVRVSSDAAAGEKFEGRITAIAPEVDSATRNVRVQATLPNPALRLRPGMFASVTIVLPVSSKNLVIPATAVLYAPYGDSVFVIDEKKNEKTGAVEKILRQQFIRLGAARGDFVAVLSGLKAGDRVVTTGVFKLRPNLSVIVDNKLAPDAQLAPKPDNS